MQQFLQKEIDSHLGYIEKLTAMDDTARVIAQIKEEIDPSLSVSLHAGVTLTQIQGIMVMIYPKHFDEVKSVLKLFALNGFYINGKPEDYAEISRRTWRLKSKEHSTPVSICAFFSDYKEGQGCKFVKVGVKEAPVYKLMCDTEEVKEDAE